MSSSNNERTATEAEELAAEIVKDIKRSGDFDKVKRDALEELQETNEIKVSRDYMLNLVRINFEKQNKERKYPPTISERRTMLRNMISNATMFDSLTNSIKNSQAFRDASKKLLKEIDKLVPQYYPEVTINQVTKQWEVVQKQGSSSAQRIAETNRPALHTHSSRVPDNNESLDMEVDSSSSTSSAEEESYGRMSGLMDFVASLPPPPPAPNF